MMKWCLAILAATLACPAWAQGQDYPTPPAACGNGAACANGHCAQPTRTVCMPEPSVKIKVSIKYSCEDTSKCYPKCFWPFGGNCDSCAAASTDGKNCGHAWPKRYLVKRIVTEEIPITKCTPVEVPACGGRFHHGSMGSYPVQPGVAPAPEAIPGPRAPEAIPAPMK